MLICVAETDIFTIYSHKIVNSICFTNLIFDSWAFLAFLAADPDPPRAAPVRVRFFPSYFCHCSTSVVENPVPKPVFVPKSGWGVPKPICFGWTPNTVSVPKRGCGVPNPICFGLEPNPVSIPKRGWGFPKPICFGFSLKLFLQDCLANDYFDNVDKYPEQKFSTATNESDDALSNYSVTTTESDHRELLRLIKRRKQDKFKAARTSPTTTWWWWWCQWQQLIKNVAFYFQCTN